MIIRNITIENFRSYYGHNSIDIGKGLTLIIGSNGDGKTTLFDALQWLFRTDGGMKGDTRFISKKRGSELMEFESDYVRVSMDYEHNGNKTIEKSFKFTKKKVDGIASFTISDYRFDLHKQDGSEKYLVDGNNFESDFPTKKRKYCMFAGEIELDILQKSNSLQQLINDFSNVKNFDPYISFMKYAVEKADAARDAALKLDSKHKKEVDMLTESIKNEKMVIGTIERELREQEKEEVNFTKLLNDIEKNKESVELLRAVNNRIENLHARRNNMIGRIQEDYTIYLLDQLWILMGFAPIAREFTEKVGKLSKERRRLEHAYQQQLGAQKLAAQLEQGFVPLSVHVPDEKVMREMIDDEVCKVCGRPAKKGTPEHNFMLHRLQEFLDSLDPDKAEDKSMFANDFITQLDKRDTTLNNNLAQDVTKKYSVIIDKMEFNESRHRDVKVIEDNIEKEEIEKRKILAHTDGLSEDDLNSAFEKITNWNKQLIKTSNRINYLKSQRQEHIERLEGYQASLDKISQHSTGAMYANSAIALRRIEKAFRNQRLVNKNALINMVESYANDYLNSLNTDDFKGTIRIVEVTGKKMENGVYSDHAEAKLMDIDGTIVTNPNTALLTTQYMSLLFAISRLAVEQDAEQRELPLIFDAPTSSFTEAKEAQFFNIIGNMGKQVIIVTKSFLTDDKDGRSKLNMERINAVNGDVYRIEKARPFDDKDLSTIRTTIRKIEKE